MLEGTLTTFKIVLASVTLNVLGGALLTPLHGVSEAIIHLPTQGPTEIVRSAPPLVLIVWAYYCLPVLFGLTPFSYLACVLAIPLYDNVLFAEIFRSDMRSVGHGLIEADLSAGMSPLTVLVCVTAPAAFLRILPVFVNQCVMPVRNFVLANYIVTGEVLYQGQWLSTAIFRPLETLTLMALFFVAIILPLSLLTSHAERRICNRYFRR